MVNQTCDEAVDSITFELELRLCRHCEWNEFGISISLVHSSILEDIECRLTSLDNIDLLQSQELETFLVGILTNTCVSNTVTLVGNSNRRAEVIDLTNLNAQVEVELSGLNSCNLADNKTRVRTRS